jgi:KaiC/GvpD/RAD55 family RecA-like ATPase
MDLDKEFVTAALAGGPDAFTKAINKGIDPDLHLFGDGRAAWNYAIEHRKEYGNIPEKDFIVTKLGIDLTAKGSESIESLMDEIMKRYLYQMMREGADTVTKSLEKKDPQAAAEAWSEIHRKITQEKLTTAKVESIFALGTEVWQQYEAMKNGLRGIATPWPTMTEQTMGWWPEDLILLVGRLGLGKTWMTLLLAYAAWKDSKKVLFISTEMANKKLATRLFAMHLKLPYNQLQRGKLGEFVEQTSHDAIMAMSQNQGFGIVGGGFDFSMDSVDAAVSDYTPDVVCVDGAYLIRNTGKDRHERVSNTFDDLKRMGKRRKLVCITNTQFNRSAKTGKSDTIAAENAGITDVAGWNADNMYALWQTDEMRLNSQIGVKPLKIREGIPNEFVSKWDFVTMDFSEITNGPDSPPPFVDNAGHTNTPAEDDLPF